MDRDTAVNKPEDPSLQGITFLVEVGVQYTHARGIPIDMSHKKSKHHRESSVVGSEGRIT